MPSLRRPLVRLACALLACAAARLAPLRAAPISDFTTATAWEFHLGAEFPGAAGELSQREIEGRPGGVIRYDFTAGGVYVAVCVPELDIPDAYTELRLRVRSASPQKLALRLADSTWQYHQIPVPYTRPGEWQTLRVPFAPLRSSFHYGGANDGALHFPLKQVWLVVDKPASAPSGEISFTDLEAIPAPSALDAPPTSTAPSSDLAPVPLNERLGVATHFGNGGHYVANWDIDTCIRAATTLGVGWLRDDLHWQNYEKTKGRHELRPRDRRWIEAAHAAGLKIVLVLYGGNPLYENPYDPDAYARAAAAVAAELKGKIQALEILNEPHNSGYSRHYGGSWNGYDADAGTLQPWVRHYLVLLDRAAKAVKAANPDLKVIGLGGVPPVNFHQLALGIAPEVDGVADHPYSPRSVPELIPYTSDPGMIRRDGVAVADAQGSFASLVRLYREQSARHRGPRELWLTEAGFPTYQEAKPAFFAGITEEAQAAYALRRFAECLGLGVDVTIWYDLKDDGGDLRNAEDHFGLLTRGNQPKPAYHAVQRLARLMQPYRVAVPAPRIEIFSENTRTDTHPIAWDGVRLAAPDTVRTYAFHHATTGRPLVLLWSTERFGGDLSPRLANLEITADWPIDHVRLIDLQSGETRAVKAERRGSALWFPELSVPSHPVALEFR